MFLFLGFFLRFLSSGYPVKGETGIAKSRLRDRVRTHQQHIPQPKYKNSNLKKDLQTYCKGISQYSCS